CTLIATGGEDGTVRLWDAATGKPHSEPLASPSPVLAVAFSPDGATLATGSLAGSAQLWDVATGKPRGGALAHRGRVKAVTFSSDSQMVATAGAVEETDPVTNAPRLMRGEVRLWRAATGRAIGPPLAHPRPVWSLAFSPG